MRSHKTSLGNILILAVSLSLSLPVVYYIYQKFRQPSVPRAVYQGRGEEYAMVLYSRKGKRLTEIEGKLKVVTDPFTLYKNYPEQRNESYFINLYGFRGRYLQDRPKKAFIVGGSAAFGQGLQADTETFAHKLGDYMPSYHFINAGIPGILSGQELSYMVHYLDAFKPELYIVFDGWNDIFGPCMCSEELPSARVPIGFHFIFFEIEKRLEAFFKTKMKENQGDGSAAEEPSPLGVKIENEDMLFEEIVQTYIANIDKMHAFARARNADFLLVFQPELGNKRNKSEEERQILVNWERAHAYIKLNIPGQYNALIQRGKNFCRAHGIQFIDINTTPGFSGNSNTLFFDAVHPNALGHEIIAQTIYSVLQKWDTIQRIDTERDFR